MAAIAPGNPSARRDGEINPPTTPEQVVGDLDSRLSASDYKHTAGRKVCRPPVFVGGQLDQSRVEQGAEGRDVRTLIGAGRDHDACGAEPLGLISAM